MHICVCVCVDMCVCVYVYEKGKINWFVAFFRYSCKEITKKTSPHQFSKEEKNKKDIKPNKIPFLLKGLFRRN